MADSDPTPVPLSSKKENLPPLGSRLTELSESRVELLTRIQGLKQDVQSWRSKLDTQVKVYGEELSELKKILNVDVEQLRSDFQELRTTLQQQQEDVTSRLKNLGLQDISANASETPNDKTGETGAETQILPPVENDKEKPTDEAERDIKEAQMSTSDNGVRTAG